MRNQLRNDGGQGEPLCVVMRPSAQVLAIEEVGE
jgi:hypothetical protein